MAHLFKNKLLIPMLEPEIWYIFIFNAQKIMVRYKNPEKDMSEDESFLQSNNIFK